MFVRALAWIAIGSGLCGSLLGIAACSGDDETTPAPVPTEKEKTWPGWYLDCPSETLGMVSRADGSYIDFGGKSFGKGNTCDAACEDCTAGMLGLIEVRPAARSLNCGFCSDGERCAQNNVLIQVPGSPTGIECYGCTDWGYDDKMIYCQGRYDQEWTFAVRVTCSACGGAGGAGGMAGHGGAGGMAGHGGAGAEAGAGAGAGAGTGGGGDSGGGYGGGGFAGGGFGGGGFGGGGGTAGSGG